MCIVRLAMDRFFTQKELRWIDQLIPEAPSRRGSTPMSVTEREGEQPLSTSSPRESPTDSNAPMNSSSSPQLQREHKLRRQLLLQQIGGGLGAGGNSKRGGRRASSVDTTDNNVSTALLSGADTDDTPQSPRQAPGSGGGRGAGPRRGTGSGAGAVGAGRPLIQKCTSTSIRSTCSSGLGTSSSSMEAHQNQNFSSASAVSLGSPSHSGATVGVSTIRELDENGEAYAPGALEIDEEDDEPNDMRHLVPFRRGSHIDKRPSIFSLSAHSQDEPETLAEQLYNLDVGAELCNTALWKDLAKLHGESERRSRRGTGSRHGSTLLLDLKEHEQKREAELPAWKR